MNTSMDPLADLPGPEDFDALLAREELRRGRTGELLAVAMIDVDGLRRVNREHGAGAGSEVLRMCVTTLRGTLRAVDEIARVGPDEFAALLHGTDSRSANIWADRFEDELAAVSFEHVAGPVTCSIGIADTQSEPSLLDAAAKAHRRMEVTQTMRKLRRAGEGSDPAGPA
jgi:diguanylate cyclase (GGDEF)-like protein